MASVRKRTWTTPSGEPKEAWIVDYKDQAGKRRSGGQFPRKKDADAKKRQLEDEIDRGVHTPNRDALTFAEVVQLWLEDEIEGRYRRGDKMSPSNKRGLYSHAKNHLVPAFGKLKVSTIDSELAQRWVDAKAEEKCAQTGERYKLRTLTHLLSDLTMILDYAVKKKLGLKRNPFRDIRLRLPEREEEPIRFLEAPDVAKLLQWVVTHPRTSNQSMNAWRSSRLVVLIAMFAGLRRGEVCALDWQRVRLDDWAIDVHFNRAEGVGQKGIKTGQRGRRTVPMNPILHAILEHHWELCGRPEAGPVVLNANGSVLEPESITQHYWPRACAQAGLLDNTGARPYSFHDLRHAAGSFWLADRMPLEEVSRLLGHTTLDTTWTVYIHKLQHDQRALQAIDGVSSRFVRLMETNGIALPISHRPQQQLELPALPMIDVTPASGGANALVPIEHPKMMEWQRRAIELFKDGVPVQKIAAEVGRAKRMVSKWLESTGLYQRPPRTGWRKVPEEQIARALAMWQANVRTLEIAGEIGVDPVTIRRWADDAGLHRPSIWSSSSGTPRPSFTDEDRELALKMWMDGRPSTEIAAAIGAGTSTIIRWSYEAGLPRRGRDWQRSQDVVSELDAAHMQHDPL